MRSALPKVMHPVAGRSLLAHVLAAAPQGPGTALAVVVGADHQAVADEARRARPDAAIFTQAERLGTAHAVLAAREAIAKGADDILVAFGDTPLAWDARFEGLAWRLHPASAVPAFLARAMSPTLDEAARRRLLGR